MTHCNLAMMETRTWSAWNKDVVMMTDWPVAGEWGMTNRRNLLMRPLLQNAGIWTLFWLQFGWSFLSLVWWTSLFQKQLETWTRQTTARTFPPCIFSGCCWSYGFRFASVEQLNKLCLIEDDFLKCSWAHFENDVVFLMQFSLKGWSLLTKNVGSPALMLMCREFFGFLESLDSMDRR